MENNEQDKSKCEKRCCWSMVFGGLLLLFVGGVGGYFIARCGMGVKMCQWSDAKPVAVAPETPAIPAK